MIYEQTNLPADVPASVPLIGWENLIFSYNASSEAAGFPATNLALGETHLTWKATSSAAQTIITFTGAQRTDYFAIAKHNFATTGARINISNSNTQFADKLVALLHFDGANNSTVFIDSSGLDEAWVPQNGAKIDTSQSKFGGSSYVGSATTFLQTRGTKFVFGTADFTIDCWIRLNASGAIYTIFDCRTAEPSNGVLLRVTTASKVQYFVNGVERILSTTVLSVGTWYHVAIGRIGTSTRLFINGTQEGGTFSDSTNYVANTTCRIGRSITAGDTFVGWIDEFRVINGACSMSANFGPPGAAYADGYTTVIGNYATLLHFDGANNSTAIVDAGGANHAWTAVGGAHLDTSQAQFGGAALRLNGTTDWIVGDGSDDFAFGLQDFTIDFWFRPNTIGGHKYNFFDARPDHVIGASAISLELGTDGKVFLYVNGGFQIQGTVVLTVATWFHIALTRSSGSTRLFINGTQDGPTYSDSNVYIIGQGPLVGQSTALDEPLDGWLEEYRVINGVALWSANFFTPTHAAGSATAPGLTVGAVDSAPIIARYAANTADAFRVSISAGTAPAQISTIYSGNLMVLERSITLNKHLVINYARKSNQVGGMSESGNFLGRITLSEWRESKAEFEWFTPDWYRANFEPFVAFAVDNPFFWAWNPDEYPEETAFAWLSEDVRPETDPVTRRVAATISMRAVV